MKNKIFLFITLCLGVLVLTGCVNQPQYVANNSSKSSIVTMGIDRQDFERAATDMVSSLLESGSLNKNGGGRYVVMISDIVNDTTQRIDIKMLTKKIRIAMLKSGKAIITSAVGTERDDTAQKTRELRGNQEFKQNTIAKKNTLYAPELSLSGDILQRTAKTNDDEQLVEYYFQLSLTDIASGLVFWEDEAVVGKLGSNDTVTW